VYDIVRAQIDLIARSSPNIFQKKSAAHNRDLIVSVKKRQDRNAQLTISAAISIQTAVRSADVSSSQEELKEFKASSSAHRLNHIMLGI
jgi:hypothetical protein